MNEIIKLSATLTLIAAVATSVLGFAHQITKQPIEEAGLRQTAESLKLILPEFDNAPSKESKLIEVEGSKCKCLPAKQGEKLIGIAVEAAAQGFGGDVKILVGFNAESDKIIKVIVSDHKETPGLGTAATNRVKQKTIFDFFSSEKEDAGLAPSKFLDQFDNKTAQLGTTLEIGRVDAISGATISSKAVTNALALASKAYEKYKSEVN